MAITFLRLPAVMTRRACSRSVIYAESKTGMLPPPIRIGRQQSAWLEHELEAVLRARIAGKNETEVKKLVKKLIAARAVDLDLA